MNNTPQAYKSKKSYAENKVYFADDYSNIYLETLEIDTHDWIEKQTPLWLNAGGLRVTY